MTKKTCFFLHVFTIEMPCQFALFVENIKAVMCCEENRNQSLGLWMFVVDIHGYPGEANPAAKNCLLGAPLFLSVSQQGETDVSCRLSLKKWGCCHLKKPSEEPS